MGIKNIPNQTIHFEVPEYDSCEEQNVLRCPQYGQADGYISTQFQILPCNTFYGDIQYTSTDCWNLIDGVYVHNTACTDSLYVNTLADLITYGNYVKYVIDINVYSGSLIVTMCGQFNFVNVSGTYTFYFNVNCYPAILEIQPASNFVGNVIVKNAQAYYIPPSPVSWITIFDQKNQPYTTLCPNPINLVIHNDIVIINLDASCFEPGCYSIEVCDPCQVIDAPWEQEFTFSQNGDDDWKYDDDCFYSGCAPLLDVQFANPGLYIASISTLGRVHENSFHLKSQYHQSYPDCCYIIQINFGAIDYGADVCDTYFQFKVAKGSTCNLTVYQPQAFSTHEFICCEPIEDLYFRQVVNTSTSTATWIINSIKIRPVNSCNQLFDCYTSNCFQVLPYNQLQGTKLVTGESTAGTYQLGFYWDGTFKLKQRLRLSVFAPTYDIDAPTYIFSDGTKSITSAQKEKIYEVAFTDLDENQHDTLSTQIITKTFKIQGVEYVVKPGAYKPEWQKSSGYPRADVRFEATKQGTIIFRSNEN